MDEQRKIPFVRPVRVGNYKLWRTNLTLGKDKEKTGIEQLCVSNLDGTWSVRLPSTSMMYATVTQAYLAGDADEFLGMVFANMQNVCLINNEYLHDGFSILREMMVFPYLFLSEKEMVKRMRQGYADAGFDKKSASRHIDKMCEYRKRLYDLIHVKVTELVGDFELQSEKRRAAEDEAQEAMERDAVAEQMLDEISDDGDGDSE